MHCIDPDHFRINLESNFSVVRESALDFTFSWLTFPASYPPHLLFRAQCSGKRLLLLYTYSYSRVRLP